MVKRVFLPAIALLISSVAAAQVPPGFTTHLVGFLTRATGQLPAGRNMQEMQKSHLATFTRCGRKGCSWHLEAGKFVPERHPWLVAEGVLPAGVKVPLP